MLGHYFLDSLAVFLVFYHLWAYLPVLEIQCRHFGVLLRIILDPVPEAGAASVVLTFLLA
jgi:hypothetical protein